MNHFFKNTRSSLTVRLTAGAFALVSAFASAELNCGQCTIIAAGAKQSVLQSLGPALGSCQQVYNQIGDYNAYMSCYTSVVLHITYQASMVEREVFHACAIACNPR